jgi:aminobenzoyl-glutamate utilization protein A
MALADSIVAIRRDLHRHPEPAWCEFRTTSKVISTLKELGWNVAFGRNVICADARMGLPATSELDRFYRSALLSGAAPELLKAMEGGFTGAVGSIVGAKPGPTIALRFDMDANLGTEASAQEHLPAREGFLSENPGVHHNCGHDGHTAIGLGVARALAAIKPTLHGTIKLIFQPAEEGLRGANAMVAAGVLQDVDFLLGAHIGVQSLNLGEVIPGYRNILASTKIDARFRGKSAHAAISPHRGHNALLAACVATQSLMALPRHGDGETRVNVGLLSGGQSRNAIPEEAKLSAELRADTTSILQDLEHWSDSVLKGAAHIHNVEVESVRVGSSCAASSDAELAALVGDVARSVSNVNAVRPIEDFKASDDVAAMMDVVQTAGGKAVYFGLGTPLTEVHHNPLFDFDERVLPIGIDIFVKAVHRLGTAQ